MRLSKHRRSLRYAFFPGYSRVQLLADPQPLKVCVNTIGW